jgi:hypothetical protein
MNTRRLSALAVMLAVLVAVTGCRTITGRTAGTWMDDKATTAKVKTALAGVQAGTVTRVSVDTFDGVVYLTGRAETEQARRELIQAAQRAAEGKPVVANLHLPGETPAAMPAAAAGTSPATTRPQVRTQPQPAPQAPVVSQQQVAATAPGTAAMPPPLRFNRIEREAGPAGTQRLIGYDDQGRRVATVYEISPQQLGQRMADLDTGGRDVDHVSIHPGPAGQYHLVLWHVDRQEAQRMR